MLKIRREAAEIVVSALHPTEAAISEAIRRGAHLVAAVEDARRHAGLSMLVATDAGAGVMRALAALGQAQSELASAHTLFSVAQEQIGLGKVMWGDGGAKPPNESVEASSRHLAVAA